MNKIVIRLVLLLLVASQASSCESFLDEKTDKKMVVPSTLEDLQSLLDNYILINYSFPNAAEISAGDYYLTDADFEALYKQEDRRMYTWEPGQVFSPEYNDWYYSYRAIYPANTVLDVIGNNPRGNTNAAEWDNVKGQALFTRANYFLQNVMIWAPAYDSKTAASDLGIPLRLDTDFHVPSTRASVQESYDRILQDLQGAASLLPETAIHPMRPAKPAAYGLLARTHLAMGQYQQAVLYADSSLRLHNTLLDYHTLDTAAAYPFPENNPEIMILNGLSGIVGTLYYARIDPDLYRLYEDNDLRKALFFQSNGDGSYAFRGGASGSDFFSGVATDELYLTRAEALARLGRINEAMQDLNTLLVTRWKAGTFVPFTATSKEEALHLVLQERRKQLLMRGLRWMDIKRLNKVGASITLTRTVKGRTYTLPPHDPRYALPIPEDVIALTGMRQNPR